jgi:tetratricopeptide (TPR) repeat protein
MQQKNSNGNSTENEIAALAEAALRHYQEGQLQQANDICQRILRQQQRPDAILILAKIAHEQGEFEAAVERYEQFLGVIPDHAQTHFNLGLMLAELGRIELAIEHYQKSITIAADNAAVHSRLADACCRLQRWEEAIKTYQQVLALQSEDVGTMIKLGNAFSEVQLFAEAILLYEQALTISPDNAPVHRCLGASLHRMGQIPKAIESFQAALRLRPDYVRARIDLARALRQLGKAEEALLPLEEAIDLEPDDGEAYMQLAATYRQLGQTEPAIEQLKQFLTISPTCGEAYYRISVIRPERELIPVVEKLLDDPGLPKSDAIYCHFALGNLLNSNESFDQAFTHFMMANTLQRETFTYNAEANIQTVDRLIKVFSDDFFQGKRRFGSDSQLPVFIVGMPRSGTTLVEQILSSHTLVYGAGEIEAFPAVNRSIAQQLEYALPTPECMSLIDREMVEEYSARYLQDLVGHCPTAERITDKFPQNFFTLGLIKTLFPNAHIVHCQRNPLDNCVSLFFHCFATFEATFELTELGQYYLQYQRLMSHWENLFPGEIFTVQYEELVQDQERVSKRLIEHIGLKWDEKCLDFHNNERNVMSASNLQVRQPMYESSIDRWKLYENQLQPLIKVLQQTA